MKNKAMKQNHKENGITLIALVITIIVLLILAGISIAILMGENGILKKATEAEDKTEKAKVIEEIQLAIMEIQIEEKEKLNEVTLETLAQGQLENKLEGITSILNENEIMGEYKGYEYKIDENFKVTVEKIQGLKLNYTLNPKGYTNGNIILTINASSTDGEITNIEVPNTLTKNDDNTYTIVKNGSYEVIATDSKGNSVTKTININYIDKVEPLDFTISKENIGEGKVKIIAKAEDGEANEDSVKSGIQKYEYFIGDTKYESSEESYVVDLNENTSRPEVYVIAYDKAGNLKRSTNSLKIGNIFYVSSAGDDVLGKGTKSNPYASIAKAINSAQLGDAIEILPGEYNLNYSVENSYRYCLGIVGSVKRIRYLWS